MEEIRTRFDAVVAAMRATGAWDVEPPGPHDPGDMGAFGMNVMAFVQWLRWIFVPAIEARLAAGGPWPESSQVAVQAQREDCPDELVAALSAFDELFTPATGDALLEQAKALDASGDIRAACVAYGETIVRGDSREDDFARDRRLQLEMQLLSRGETPPPPPETARADSAAFAIVQTTAARLRTAHAFMVRPTQRRGERVMPAVIGTVVDGRAIGHCIVGADTHTLGAGGRLVPGDHLFDRLSTGFDPKALTIVDAAMVVFDMLHGAGWAVRDGNLVVHLGVDVAVSPLDGGGVVLTLPDTMIEIPRIADFRERLSLLELELAAATR